MIDFEKLTPYDGGIIFAAFLMMLGAFCPIVSFPVVGSVNYVMGGHGDGIFVVVGAVAIIVLILSGYRRITAIIAGACALWMIITLAKISSHLANVREKFDQSIEDDPFGRLAKVMGNSVGLEWGWVLLFGGAIAVVVLVLAAPRESANTAPSPSEREPNEASFSNADRLIAEYLANQKTRSAQHVSSSTPVLFGKRNRSSENM